VAHNETDIDLPGFDFLVDELLVLLKEPRLLLAGNALESDADITARMLTAERY